MAQQINRILQDKINQLTINDLMQLGRDYEGKQVVVIWDGNFKIQTIKSFKLSPFEFDTSSGYKKGDLNIIFEFEDRFLNLLDIAIVGDTINVMNKNDDWENLMIADIQTDGIINKIEFDNGRKIDYGNMDTIKEYILPMVMDIGWLANKELITFEQDFLKNDIIDFGNKIYFIKSVKNVYNPEDRLIEYVYLDNYGKTQVGDFRAKDFDFTWTNTPNVVTMDEGDVFINDAKDTEIKVNKIYKRLQSPKKIGFPPKLVDSVIYNKVSGERMEETRHIADFLEYLVLNKFTILREEKVEEKNIEPKPLNMEGDFIAEFLNNNASNLLELEKNNRPLFDVVEMTLNLLNKKFGKGEDITEKVDVVIENAEEMIRSVQGKDPNLIGLKEIKVEWNEGVIQLDNQVFTSWTEFTNALKPLYDDTIGGYNKVKFKATFDDGKYIIHRVDVGVNDFNPMTTKVGEYIDRPFSYFDNLDDDLDKYQFDDEIVITEGGLEEITPDDIQLQIDSLKMVMMSEDDAEKIKELEEVIKGLEISKVLKLIA